ncbi:MAG TPA: tetratricopeptide repeat protein [Verrucomicrobiae bacterium]|nr:tetratricopeptide repeat protein [Verrucomicrobiae bacterium]
MPHRSCRGVFCTGVLVCTLGSWFVPVLGADTNPSTNAATRAREDRNTALTIALQAVQQIQTQERATLQAVEAVRQQTESLRHLLYGLCAGAGVVAFGVAMYVRSWLRELRRRGQVSLVFKCPLPGLPRAHDQAAHAEELLGRGQALLEQKHPVDALACFEQAIALDPPTATMFIKRGVALERLGRLEEALASYEQALTLDPSHADAYIGKGNVLNRLERYQEALACFERAAHHQSHNHVLPLGASATQ